MSYRRLTSKEVKEFAQWWAAPENAKWHGFRFVPNPDYPGNLVQFQHPITNEAVQTTEYILQKAIKDITPWKKSTNM